MLLRLLDQRKLPGSEEYVSCSTPEQVFFCFGDQDDVIISILIKKMENKYSEEEKWEKK